MEALALIAWWPAEVLSNGLADCFSHYRGGLHLPGSRPSAPRMLFSPGLPSIRSCVPPLPLAPAHSPGPRKLAPGPPGHSLGQAKVMVTNGLRSLGQGLGRFSPCQDPFACKGLSSGYLSLISLGTPGQAGSPGKMSPPCKSADGELPAHLASPLGIKGVVS